MMNEHGSSALNGTLSDGEDNEIGSIGEDESEDKQSSSIHIEVTVSNRKASSIDTNYDDYVKKFDTEEYLLQIEASDVKSNSRFDDDDDDDEFHKNTSGSSHAQCQNKRELCKRIDSVETIPMEEKEVDDSHGVEFWCGYGSNIYFQPMTCKALPCIRVRSKEGNSQMLRFSRRHNRKKKRQISPMGYRLDIPVIKDALENIGTLKISRNSETAGFKDSYSNGQEIQTRVGSFVMSEDVKNRLCKGFACRNIENGSLSPRPASYREVASKDIGIFVKNSARSARMGAERRFNRQKLNNYGENVDRRNNIASDENKDIFALLPKMNLAFNHVDKVPRKKVIAGQSFHLTNSAQTIKRVNLFPFNQPVVGKEPIVKRTESLQRPLYTSPVPDEEEKPPENVEEKVVADHLQEMKIHGNFESKNQKGTPSEKQYSYESLLSYYNDKANVVKNDGIEKALMTASLISPQKPQRKLVDNSQHQTLENHDKYRAGKKGGANRYSGTGTENAIAVTGRELNLAGKHNSLSDLYVNEKTPPVSRQLSGNGTRIRPNFSLEDDKLLRGYDPDFTFSDILEEIESLDLHQSKSKTVHFDEKEDRFVSNEIASSAPFIAKSAKPVDRYEVPASKSCRLPIIGQKITTNAT